MSGQNTARTPTRTPRQRAGRPDGLLTTGDMARLSNNTLRTVRFYEEAGIVRPDKRSAGGHRLFHRRELERLRFVSDLRGAGLSLDQIRSLLELKRSARSAAEAATQVRQALNGQLEALEQRIRAYSRLRRELQRAHDSLRSCCHCEHEQWFPDRCGECYAGDERTRLPQSMRVLWGLA